MTQCLVAPFCGGHLQVESEGLPQDALFFPDHQTFLREKYAHFLTWAQPVMVLGQRPLASWLGHLLSSLLQHYSAICTRRAVGAQHQIDPASLVTAGMDSQMVEVGVHSHTHALGKAGRE